MRRREARLRRSLRGIVLAALATPAALAACAASKSEGASTPDASSGEAGAADDVSIAPGHGEDASIDAAASDASACAPIATDGAGLDDAADGCATYRRLPCGPPDAKIEDCLIDLVTCAQICGTNLLYYCQLLPPSCDVDSGVHPEAPMIVDCVSCAGAGGRRPRGLCMQNAPKRTALGDYFADMAHLESASVRAFRDLEEALAILGAPLRLRRAARDAAMDERRHARSMARLARRFGGVTRRPRIRHAAAPTLMELLEDDAIEGCIGETWGALVATWQAEAASDSRVRAALNRIATDETRHAALAWEVLAWGMAKVAPRERARIARLLEAALGDLARRAEIPVDFAIAMTAGHPSAPAARRLVQAMTRVVQTEARSAGARLS